MTILVTGAPGNTGTPLVDTLLAQGVPVRVGANTEEKARRAFPTADVRHFDFLDASTWDVFAGVEKMFLVRPPALSNVDEQIAPALRSAVDQGVQHIVFLSLQGVENNRVTPHYKIEQLIRTLPVTYTFLRASFFMQNLSTTHLREIRDRDEISVPVGNARTSFLDVRDIASVASLILTQADSTSQAYTLTGAEALTYTEVAQILSKELGRPIRYANPWIIGFFVRQVREGTPAGFAAIMTMLYTITRFGNAKEVTEDVARLLGRLPISFAQFAHDTRAVWIK